MQKGRKRMKPIIFNTEMVKAILDGRKTVTRRKIKQKNVDDVLNSEVRTSNPDIPDDRFIKCLCNAPYEVGDILYVRETIWQKVATTLQICGEMEMFWHNEFKYVATDEEPGAGWNHTWSKRPSIHMPKDAARIFLKVTDVRVERLKDISHEERIAEGIKKCKHKKVSDVILCGCSLNEFIRLWDSTIKNQDIDQYGWDANPWVWVIEFERTDKQCVNVRKK